MRPAASCCGVWLVILACTVSQPPQPPKPPSVGCVHEFDNDCGTSIGVTKCMHCTNDHKTVLLTDVA